MIRITCGVIERRTYMQYSNNPIDNMVNEIKGTTGFLSKVIFAGINLILIIILGIIIVSSFAIQ